MKEPLQILKRNRILFQGKETLNIPQIVVIDKAGVIRAQNGGQYDPNLENENSLRSLLLGLLQKGA